MIELLAKANAVAPGDVRGSQQGTQGEYTSPNSGAQPPS